MLAPLNIPPGAYRNGTEYQSKGRWRDVNLVRWHEGAMRPVDGWRGVSSQELVEDVSYISGVMEWVDNSGNRWLIYGKHDDVWALDIDDFTTVANIDPGVTGNQDQGSASDPTVWHFDMFGELPLALSTTRL